MKYGVLRIVTLNQLTRNRYVKSEIINNEISELTETGVTVLK